MPTIPSSFGPKAPQPEPPPEDKKDNFFAIFFKKLEDFLSGADPKQDQIMQEKLNARVVELLEWEKQLKIADEQARQARITERRITRAAQQGRLGEYFNSLAKERRAQQPKQPEDKIIENSRSVSPPPPSSQTRPSTPRTRPSTPTKNPEKPPENPPNK